MPQVAVGLRLHNDAPRARAILQLLADAYGIDGITPDDTGLARLWMKAPEDIPAYLSVMGDLEACARDSEDYITVLKLPG